MITEEDILRTINRTACDVGFPLEIKEYNFPKLARVIYLEVKEKTMGEKIEMAELSAKVKAYEAIIMNSNFKAAVAEESTMESNDNKRN